MAIFLSINVNPNNGKSQTNRLAEVLLKVFSEKIKRALFEAPRCAFVLPSS